MARPPAGRASRRARTPLVVAAVLAVFGAFELAQAVRIDSSGIPVVDGQQSAAAAAAAAGSGAPRPGKAAAADPEVLLWRIGNATNGLGTIICMSPSYYQDYYGVDVPPLDNQNVTRLVLPPSEPPINASSANGVTTADVAAWANAKFYAAAPGLNETSVLRPERPNQYAPKNDWTDDQGVRHVRLVQFVPSLGGILDLGAIIVHMTTADSTPFMVTGGVYNFDPSLVARRSAAAGPGISASQAAAAALAAVLSANPTLPPDAVARMRAAAAAQPSAAAASAAGNEGEGAQRIVYCNQRGACEAAYKQVIFVPSSPKPKSMHVWVSAATGKVLWAADRLRAQSSYKPATGSGRGLYVGRTTPVPLRTSAVPGRQANSVRQYVLRDMTWKLQTYDLGGRDMDMIDRAKLYSGPRNAWGDGTFRSKSTLAVDAHYGLTTTLDYYSAVHGRNSYDNRGGALNAYTYLLKKLDNAFYDSGAMYFGAGSLQPRAWLTSCSSTSFPPLVTLDIAAHELSHGVTEYGSGLNYYHSSGGINEAMSDIMGQCVMQWSYEQGRSTDPADFLVGSGMYKPANCSQGALRWMADPPRDGRFSFGCWDPRVDQTVEASFQGFSQSYWCEVDVHHSSGVANRAFWLATAGFNTSCNTGSKPAAIGWDKACKVFYRANAAYLAPSSDFWELRAATTRAAHDLYGACSPEVDAIKAAWDTVGAPTAPFPAPNATACEPLFATDPASC